MNQSIFLIVFGTFGSPNGFKQTFYEISDNNSDSNLARGFKTFDLNTNAISLFPKSKMYAIRKEVVNGQYFLSYSVYTFAKEQGSDRGGTFIGSSICYQNEIAEETQTIDCLNELHHNLVSKNVENDIIKVNHSNNFRVDKPKNFDKLRFGQKEVGDLNFSQFSNRNLVVYCKISPDKLCQLFKKSVDLLNNYDTIYFTDNEEVATFVNQKKIFMLAPNVNAFEQELQKLSNERIERRQLLIDELETEKSRLGADKIKRVANYHAQIEENIKVHSVNGKKIEESKDALVQIEQEYSEYSKELDSLITCLNSGESLQSAKRTYTECKTSFVGKINQHTALVNLGRLSTPQYRSDIRRPYQQSQPQSFNYTFSNVDHRETRLAKSDIFKISTFALSILWIGTIAYFLFFHNRESDVVDIQPQEDHMYVAEQPAPSLSSKVELKPAPNFELNENDIKKVAKKLELNMELSEVVKIIFANNPSDIKRAYFNQLEAYSQKLIEMNPSSFKGVGGKFYYIDSLENIPALKKQ